MLTYTCYSILKAKHTTGSLTHTQTHTHRHPHARNSNNYKQKAIVHVTSLTNGHFTGSDASYVCEIPTPAGFDPTKACFKRSRWLGKRHKTDAFIKLGKPTIRAACTPQTVFDRHCCCLFCFFYKYLAIFPAVLLYPQQRVPTSALHPQALTECSPLDFRRSSIMKIIFSNFEDVPLVEFTYSVFTRMPGQSYRRQLRSSLLCFSV